MKKTNEKSIFYLGLFTRRFYLPVKCYVLFCKNKPVLGINILTLIVTLTFAFKNYHNKILGLSDSLVNFAPQRANSFIEYIYKAYISSDGRVIYASLWGLFQRISYYFNIEDPTKYPWFLPVGLTQFFLLASAVNITYFLHKYLNLSKLSSVCIFIFLFSTYSINTTFLYYSFNPGMGMYPHAIYLLTLLLINLLGNAHRRIWLNYFILMLVFLDSDSTRFFAFLFFIYVFFEIYLQKKISKKKFIKISIVTILLFTITTIFILSGSGFSNRMQGINSVVKVAELIDRIYLFLNRVLNSTYGNVSLFDGVDVNNFHYFFLFSFIVVVILNAASIKRKNMDDFILNNRYFSLLIITILGLYGTQLRVFATKFHAVYTDDNSTFFLVLIFCLVFIFFKNNLTIFWKKVLPSCIIGYLIIFHMPQTINLAIFQYEKAKANGIYLRELYNDATEKGQQTTGTKDIIINGYPGNETIFYPGNLQQMLNWSQTKINSHTAGFGPMPKINSHTAGFGPMPKNASFFDNVLPLINPMVFPFLIKKPLLLRTLVFSDKKVFDILIPKDECTIKIFQNPHFVGCQHYINYYEYKLSLVRSWNFYENFVGYKPILNKIYSAEGLNGNFSISVNFVTPNAEVSMIPLSGNKIVRFHIQGGNSEFMDQTTAPTVTCD
jgi:hypothetical protein